MGCPYLGALPSERLVHVRCELTASCCVTCEKGKLVVSQSELRRGKSQTKKVSEVENLTFFVLRGKTMTTIRASFHTPAMQFSVTVVLTLSLLHSDLDLVGNLLIHSHPVSP